MARRHPLIWEKRLQSRNDTGNESAGILFTGCRVMEARQPQPHQQAQAQAQAAPRRREVVVGGRRVKTIDVHAHYVVPKALALMGRTTRANQSRGPGISEVGLRRLGEMDAQGIDVEAISINPFWYRAECDLAADVIPVNNETLTAWCAAHPDRFLGFAAVALQLPALAVQQLEQAIKTLHRCGVAVGASVAGAEFSAPQFHPFWATCEALGILGFMPPQSTPDWAPRWQGNGWLANTIGNPLDTTIALSHRMFEGTLERLPGLQICSAPGGGYLPAYAPRSAQSQRVAPDRDTGGQLKQQPTEYLRRLYYDTRVCTAEALRHLAAEVGVSQLVIGTDHPIPWQDQAVDHLLNAPGFTDEERRAMLGETAAKWLGLAP